MNSISKTDLRIGNVVGIKPTALHADGCNHLKACFEISELHEDVVFFKGFGVGEHYKDLNPIEITEEWLSKLGLEQLEDYDTEYSHKDEDVTFIIEYSNHTESYHFTGGMSLMFGNGCKYVHQLQNLYFSLTNRELVFDPK